MGPEGIDANKIAKFNELTQQGVDEKQAAIQAGPTEQEAEAVKNELTQNKNYGNFGSEGNVNEPEEPEEKTNWNMWAAIGVGVGALAAGVGAILLRSKALGKVATLLGAGALGVGTSSCTNEEPPMTVNQNTEQSVTVTINANSSLEEGFKALLDAMNAQAKELNEIKNILKQILVNQINQGKTLEDIVKIAEQMGVSLGVIISLLKENNNLLTKVYDQLQVNGKTEKDTLNVLLQIKTLIENMKPSEGQAVDPALLQQLIALLQANNLKLDDIAELLKQNGVKLDVIVDMMNQQLGNDEQIKKLLKENNELLKAILDAMGNLGSEVNAQLQAILAQLKKGNAKIDDVIALLNTINANVVQGNNDNKEMLTKILAAINKLGVDQAKYFNLILDAINRVGDQIPDYTALLNAILAKLDRIGDSVDNGFNASLAKMQEILEAIQNHEVHVTVDVTGKVTCECNCQGGGGSGDPHEGILNDINNLIS